MAEGRRVEIAGSALRSRPGELWSPAGAADPLVTVTAILRRPAGSLDLSGLTREQAEAKMSANPGDMQAAREFATQHGLTITGENVAARTMHLTGSAAAMEQAFGVRMGWLEAPGGQKYLAYQGAIQIPAELDGIITAVLGLDQRPVAHFAGH